MLKTKKVIEVPILSALGKYLRELPQESEYCYPELAERYRKSRCTIGAAVTAFLTDLGIESNRKVEGRSRRVSVKDIHSCRHTFCYLAALNGVPFPVVQGVVGHMSPEMTKRYMNHASADAKREALEKIPDYMGGVAQLPSLAPSEIKVRAHSLIDGATDEEVDRWLKLIESGA
jgi:integrase